MLILSGDHIYKMDYNAMLRYHEQVGADCTIAVRDVPLAEASRFGIMNTNADGSIYEFEEKPAHPKSTNASMGIYIFRWEVLRKYLLEDDENPESQNDFGKNIIPMLLNSGHKLYAYEFNGYWKDVGTISSLWEANMELLGPEPAFDLHEGGKIYARNYAMPSSFVSRDAVTEDSLIAEGCEIFGIVRHSVISSGCTIEAGAVVEDSVIMPNVHIKADAIIRNAIIGENVEVNRSAIIGGGHDSDGEREISVISKGSVIKEGVTVAPGVVR